jgi:hypothetical protein
VRGARRRGELAAIWILIDYPLGLWLFLFTACAHRTVMGG